MKAGIYGIIFTFIATLVIFGLVKKNNIGEISFPKSFSFRFLSNRTTEELTDYMCSKSSSDLVGFYNQTSSDYEFEIPDGSSVMREIVKAFISNSSDVSVENIGKEQVKNYFTKSPKYIIILIIFILFTLLWLPYCFCICCKCCLCCPDCCLKCPNVFIFCGIVLCALILINCFIGYTENGSIVNGIYGLGCSSLKIEQHLIKGDEFTVNKPYWVGINTIITKLQETSHNISTLETKTKNIENQLKTIDELFTTFSENVTNEYTERSTSELKNPIPDEKDFLPLNYYKLYGPPTEEETALYLVQEEINRYHDYTFKGLEGVISVINNATDQATSISTKINDISNSLDTKVKDIDNKIGEEIRKYDDIIDQIDSYSRNYMNFLFSINLLLIIVVCVSLILLLLCKCGKLLLCISWVFLYLLMLSSFLLGAIFGLLGSFVQDASSCAIETIRDIKSIDKLNDDVKKVVDICLNGNGSLAQSNLIPLDYNTEIIDNIYNLEVKIDEGIELIEDYSPISIKENEKQYNKLKERPKMLLKELQTALVYMQTYTDLSVGDTHVSSSTPIYDEWEIHEADCIYTYSPHKETKTRRLSEENKVCLVLTEWSLEDITDRYKDIQSSDDINIIEQIEKYYNSINDFIVSNNELIGSIKEQNKAFNNSFNNIGKEEVKVLKGIKDIILPFRDSFIEILGKDGKSIFEILNCRFLKRDVNKVIEVLYDSFGSSFQVTAALFIMISCYELAINLIVLIIIAALNKQRIKSADIDFYKDDEEK